MSSSEAYPFQSSDSERERLIAQSRMLAPMTERLFKRAGIAAGMRVLDIGSGSGDVAMLAAKLVGPEGDVIGIDRDRAQVEYARQRAITHGFSNVHFMHADMDSVELDEPVDAIVGRLALMYVNDPAEALRNCVGNLRAGGIVALVESVIDYDAPAFITPRTCLAARAVEWFTAGFRYSNVQPRMGLRLFSVMREAGLEPSIDMDMMVPVQQGPDGELFPILVAVVRSQLNAILASGIATEADIDVDTLERRMVADSPPGGVVGYFHAGHVGVWARLGSMPHH
jgi:protein-L-isoaspartate O-methyltransferase